MILDKEAGLDIHEEGGEESSLMAALADLDGSKVELDSLLLLLDLSDQELIEYSSKMESGILSLESFLAPGGQWGGTVVPVRRAAQIGARNGLLVTDQKRTWGSPGSDHHTSQKQSFAVDMSNGTGPTAEMLRTARQIAAALGYRWPDNGYLATPSSSHGIRAQLIYNSSVVPNHHNHVHFGVRKVR